MSYVHCPDRPDVLTPAWIDEAYAGLQARVLNRIVADQHAHRGFQAERLSELLGHTPVEVFVGAACGTAYAIFLYL